MAELPDRTKLTSHSSDAENKDGTSHHVTNKEYSAIDLGSNACEENEGQSLNGNIEVNDNVVNDPDSITERNSTMENQACAEKGTSCCPRLPPCSWPTFSWQCLKNFVINNFLPLGLIFLVILGVFWPTPGHFLDHKATQYIAVIGIFLYSGLFLRTDELKAAITAYRAILWGIPSILFFTSILGAWLTGLLPFNHRVTVNVNGTEKVTIETGIFGPEEIQRGLQVFFSGPCTISTGVVMVTQAGGNYALALLLTVVCNVVAAFTIPLILNWLLELEGKVSLDVKGILLKLFLTIFIPTVVGKGLQYIPQVRRVSTRFKLQLKLLSIALLILLPWMKISTASSEGRLSQLGVKDIFLIICWTATVHTIFLLLNRLACFILRLQISETKSIVILASQKTLAVALTVVTFLPSAAGVTGLLVVPLIIAHFTIVIIDSVFVVAWAQISPLIVEETTNRKEEEEALSTNNK